jgi:hypothetical protein
VSGLLTELAHVGQARSRCLRCCPGVAVVALGRLPHRARGGHGLLIRSSMSGHPDRFRSVRDLGRASARCSAPSGISECRSPRWLPEWLPVNARHVLARPWPWRPAPPPHWTDCCRAIRRSEGVKDRLAQCVNQAHSPVLVALRKHRSLTPQRRRITIRWQSGGGPVHLPRSCRGQEIWSNNVGGSVSSTTVSPSWGTSISTALMTESGESPAKT